jgi:surface antigen
MDELAESFPRKLFFLFLSLLVAAGLMLFTAILVSPTTKAAFRKELKQPPAVHLSQAIGFAGSTLAAGLPKASANSGLIPKYVAQTTSVSMLIRPDGSTRIPTIPSLPDTAVAAATPAPAPAQQPAATLPVQPASFAKPLASPTPRCAGANLYAWGKCTWWAFARRAQTNDPIPNNWGNAYSWAAAARANGYLVNHQPSPGAIMQTGGGLGHVAFVESVDHDGSWHISEMNVVGINQVDYKTNPAGLAANYYFIHDKV